MKEWEWKARRKFIEIDSFPPKIGFIFSGSVLVYIGDFRGYFTWRNFNNEFSITMWYGNVNHSKYFGDSFRNLNANVGKENSQFRHQEIVKLRANIPLLLLLLPLQNTMSRRQANWFIASPKATGVLSSFALESPWKSLSSVVLPLTDIAVAICGILAV